MIRIRYFGEIDVAGMIAGVVGVALMLLLGAGIGKGQLSASFFLYMLVAAIFLVIVFAAERGLQIGFLLWILSFGLGYRAIRVTNTLLIHPSEVVLWFLFAVLIVRKAVLHHERLAVWLPRWLWLFMPFWMWGVYIGIENNRPPDLMFAELKNFLLLIPLMFVAETILENRDNWRKVVLFFYIVGALIATLGIIEYVFPRLSSLLPGLFHDNRIMTAEGFVRAGFSFWGTPAATFICCLSFISVNTIWSWWPRSWQRVLIIAALSAHVIGIYIGGYRSMWLTMGVIGIIWTVRRFGFLKGMLGVIPVLLSYQFLPMVIQERFLSLSQRDMGQFADTSEAKRWSWAADTLIKAINRPAGLGWGGAGWPHSDFIQVAANLGMIAGLLFLASYLVVFWRLLRLQRHIGDEQRSLGLTLLLSFIAVGSLLAFQGVEVLPQFALPVWFVWTLVEVWRRQAYRDLAG